MNACSERGMECVRGTILIVDDVPFNLGVVVNGLNAVGHQVLIAEDGEEALERAAFVLPDLILVDVMLPGISGLDVCRRLKADPRTAAIPVIFVTAGSDPDQKLAGFEAGAVDYLSKPLHIEEVAARVRIHLRLAALQYQLEESNRCLQQHSANLEARLRRQTQEIRASNTRLREEIAERRRDFQSLVELSPDTIARYDRQCRRTYANPALRTALEKSGKPLLGVTPAENPGGANGLAYEKKLREVVEQATPSEFELRWRDTTGEACTHIRLTPEFDANGNVTQILAVGRDITDIDCYRKHIYRLAYSDPLTGLPNRSALFDRVRAAAGSAADGPGMRLMILDLDNFRAHNDTMGNSAGDAILRATAQRLQALVQVGGYLAHVGADEFALLVPLSDAGLGAEEYAYRVLEAVSVPMQLDSRERVVTASIGIACLPQDSGDAEELYRFADAAMHHAKKLGRNTFQFHSQELTQNMAESLELENDLRHAERKGELELFYQPQIELDSGAVIGAEALLRWRRRGTTLVTPDVFIPLAEASGMIVSIGEWVLRAACARSAAWNAARERNGQTPLRIAVNLSCRQFARAGLLPVVAAVLDETGCKAEWLQLEITEGLLLEDSPHVTFTLQALDRMGLSIAIDDFGTGYSALSYLNRFPVRQIKIDRSFVSGVPGLRDKAELVKAMLSISSALRLEVVAEGVETQTQAEFLTAHGCQVVQGYLYGAPMPADQFESRFIGEGAGHLVVAAPR